MTFFTCETPKGSGSTWPGEGAGGGGVSRKPFVHQNCTENAGHILFANHVICQGWRNPDFLSSLRSRRRNLRPKNIYIYRNGEYQWIPGIFPVLQERFFACGTCLRSKLGFSATWGRGGGGVARADRNFPLHQARLPQSFTAWLPTSKRPRALLPPASFP